MADESESQSNGSPPAPEGARVLKTIEEPVSPTIEVESVGPATREDRDRAKTIRNAHKRGELVSAEDLDWIAAYERDHPRGRPKKRRELRETRPPVAAEHYRAGKKVEASTAKPTPGPCGDPDCWRCHAGHRICATTGKPIYPKPTPEECETYARGMLYAMGFGIAQATGTERLAVQEEEVRALAPAIQQFVWRRLGFVSAYGDIFAIIGVTGALAGGRYMYAIEQQEAKRRARYDPGKPMERQDSPVSDPS